MHIIKGLGAKSAASASSSSQILATSPRPMKNIGNSCYINSVLQMLAAMPGFQTHLCTMQEALTHRSSDSAQPPPLLAGLCSLLTSVLNTPSAESLESVDIIDLRSHFQAPFSAKEQQDAEEFLDYILNYLETAGFGPVRIKILYHNGPVL